MEHDVLSSNIYIKSMPIETTIKKSLGVKEALQYSPWG
jgi:hypothetical protein